MSRSWALKLASTAVAIAALVARLPAAEAGGQSAAKARFLRVVDAGVARPHLVSMKKASSGATLRPRSFEGALPVSPRQLAAARRRAATDGGRQTGVVTLSGPTPRSISQRSNTGASAITSPPPPSVHVSFDAMSYDSQQSSLGFKDAPPDTQIAAGPTYVAETVNASLSVWTKTGSMVALTNLETFFPVPTAQGYFFSDPQIAYDAAAGRWYVSGLSVNPDVGGELYVAASVTDDPTGAWNVYTVSKTQGVVQDQPQLGFNDDKVILSSNDGSTDKMPKYLGVNTIILQKSDLLSGAQVHMVHIPEDKRFFQIVPARSLSPSTTEYLTTNLSALGNTSNNAVGVLDITGTPVGGNVRATAVALHMAGTRVPSAVPEPGGGTIDGGDDRFEATVWRDGLLWTTGNDVCTPSGDTSARECSRYVEFSTEGRLKLVQNFDLAAPSANLYYPALGLDGSGNMLTIFSMSTPSTYPGIAVAGQPFDMGPVYPVLGLTQGQAAYSDVDPRLQRSRWGDYSGAALDPVDPTTVWVAAEYAATASDPKNWGTTIASLGVPPDTDAPVLSRVHDGPDPFSPNSDGFKDKTKIHWSVSQYSTVTDQIRAPSGRVVRTFSKLVFPGPHKNVWNGRNNGGRALGPGRYTYEIVAVDPSGNTSVQATGTVTLKR